MIRQFRPHDNGLCDIDSIEEEDNQERGHCGSDLRNVQQGCPYNLSCEAQTRYSDGEGASATTWLLHIEMHPD